MKIDFTDFKSEFKFFEKDLVKKFKFIGRKGDFILGQELVKFEKKISKFLNVKYVLGIGNWTEGMIMSCKALNFNKDDEIITVSNSFIATCGAIAYADCKPILVDVDETLNMDVNLIEKKITKKTKAIMPVHLSGIPSNITQIKKIAKKYNLIFIEDAAHAFLGKYKNKSLGTYGDIGVFSFHETKNLVAGQGGCISINNPSLLKRANSILDKGTDRKKFLKNFKKKIIKSNNKKFYSWVDVGSKYRSSKLKSDLLNAKMLKEKKIQKKRKVIWQKFNKIITNIKTNKFYLVKPLAKSTSAYHLFVLIFKNKKLSLNFKNKMQKNNIAATFHYVPLHESIMGKKFNKKKLPITENIYKRIVRLPLFPDLTKKEINKIEYNIKRFTYE